MADIAFVSVTDAPGTDTVSSITQSVVVSAGVNLAMIVALQTRSGGSGVDSPAASVVFNGSESLTKIRRDVNNPGGGSPVWGTELWYLLRPSQVTANVVATFNDSHNDAAMGMTIVLLSNVNALDASTGAISPDNSTPTITASLTTIADRCWVIDSAIGRDDNGLTMVSHTNRTQRTNRIIGNALEGVGISTLGPASPAGSYTLDWTQTNSGNDAWTVSLASFSPFVVTQPVFPYKPLILSQAVKSAED